MARARVVLEGVWKKFRRGERHDSLRDLVPALARRAFNRKRSTELEGDQEFWALKDISVEVQPGEALGIIGSNGAGKSTTLKLLTRILRPTRGHCRIEGRVGALIEVAAGFHPDLTGRENIYLQGAIMGMKRAEIAGKLDEVIEFAGVLKFVDTPVKRYSSGMNARLGFAIAAHLDPQVLIIDEVLSVGDSAFQQRCVERMQEFRRNGVTIVFVSHDLQAVSRLCDRGLYLKGGVAVLGPTQEILNAYLLDSERYSEPAPDTAVAIVRGALMDRLGRTQSAVQPGAVLTLRIDYQINDPLADLTLGFRLYRSTDHLIVYEGTVQGQDMGFDSERRGHVAVDFDFTAHLTRGLYHVECYVLHNPTYNTISRLCPAAMFNVNETLTSRGVADVDLHASVFEPAVK